MPKYIATLKFDAWEVYTAEVEADSIEAARQKIDDGEFEMVYSHTQTFDDVEVEIEEDPNT